MNLEENQAKPQLTAIELKRRTQLVEATIEVLAEIGYVGTSFAKIAEHAKISRSLALYHFRSKDDLMFQTIQYLMQDWHAHIAKEVDYVSLANDKLAVYIRSNFNYMVNHPSYFPAVVEIFFNARDPQGQLLYRIPEDDPNMTMLKNILQKGQQSGEFSTMFDLDMVAISIRASIDQVLGQMHLWPSFDVDHYVHEILGLYSSALTPSTKS